MDKDAQNFGDGVAVTRLLAEWIAHTEDGSITPVAFEWAKHAMLDWLAVCIAGAGEPMVGMLAEAYAGPADAPCTVLARGTQARTQDAALINGTAGHALDYDDVAQRMVGHPTVPVAPAVLALAQARGATGRELLRALVVGHEIESCVGEMVGTSQYAQGFHPTGTIGTLGAAAACANLCGLTSEQTVHALGLASTQASGLKSMFGTMAKPLHAGKAAMNGLMAAQLAAQGFTAAEDAIECSQGFAHTLSPQRNRFAAPIDASRGFAIQSTLFKYHAACYLTHSTIEAIRLLRQDCGVELDALDSMLIRVAGNQRGVCDITSPQTGLQVKFSIQHLAALAIDGADTADLRLYTDQTALDPRYIEATKRIALEVVVADDRDTATVVFHTRSGECFTRTANVAIPATDLQAQWQRLVAKARAIAEPVLGSDRFDRFVMAVDSLDRAPSLHSLFKEIQ